MHGGRLLSLRRQWRGFWPSLVVGFCFCFTSLSRRLWIRRDGLTCFSYRQSLPASAFPKHTHSEHQTEKVKCRIESKRRRAHRPPASQSVLMNRRITFPEHFPTVKTQRRILWDFLSFSLFGFSSFLLAAPPFLKHWNPTEMRRVLTFDGLISTAQSKPARLFAPPPLWPSSTSSSSSSSNRIHCVPSFGVWRWGKTTNGLWRQPVVFSFFILLFVFFFSLSHSLCVCTSSPFLRPTTFG